MQELIYVGPLNLVYTVPYLHTVVTWKTKVMRYNMKMDLRQTSFGNRREKVVQDYV